MPLPPMFASPSLMKRTGGDPGPNAPPRTNAISSVVRTSMDTSSSVESATTRTDASAMKGCARRIRSDSARRSSLHGVPWDSSRKRRTTSGSVVWWTAATMLASGLTRRSTAAVGADVWIVMVLIRCPTHRTNRGSCPVAPVAVTVVSASATTVLRRRRLLPHPAFQLVETARRVGFSLGVRSRPPERVDFVAELRGLVRLVFSFRGRIECRRRRLCTRSSQRRFQLHRHRFDVTLGEGDLGFLRGDFLSKDVDALRVHLLVFERDVNGLLVLDAFGECFAAADRVELAFLLSQSPTRFLQAVSHVLEADFRLHECVLHARDDGSTLLGARRTAQNIVEGSAEAVEH